MGTTKGNPTRGEAESYAAVLERQNRRLWMGNSVQAFINLGLCVTIIGLFPLKTVEPVFFRFGDPSDKVVFVTQGDLSVTERTALAETALTDYVRKRETIDHLTAQQRDDWLRTYSSGVVWEYFVKRYSPQNPQSPRRKALEAQVSRSVYINSITPVPASANTYNIFYTLIDRRTGTDEELRRSEYIATLSYANRPLAMDTEEFQMNPTGITVVNYDIQPRAYEDLSR